MEGSHHLWQPFRRFYSKDCFLFIYPKCWFPRFWGTGEVEKPFESQWFLFLIQSVICSICFPCLHVELTPKRADKRRISKQTLPGFEADIKVTWFQWTGLEHEPFVCCWKFSTWISGWAVQFTKENVDTSCQRLFSLVPENGRHCVFGTHKKSQQWLNCALGTKALTWGQDERPQASAHPAWCFAKSVAGNPGANVWLVAGVCMWN